MMRLLASATCAVFVAAACAWGFPVHIPLAPDATFVTAGGTGWLANLYNFHETDKREQAYRSYDASLRERLGLPPAEDAATELEQ